MKLNLCDNITCSKYDLVLILVLASPIPISAYTSIGECLKCYIFRNVLFEVVNECLCNTGMKQ